MCTTTYSSTAKCLIINLEKQSCLSRDNNSTNRLRQFVSSRISSPAFLLTHMSFV